uniref:pancreatic secretory granule membrane major glycoprotein GP2-like n=1 Tax=Pristiophorus japonicus TaxID=55135 RepID=UPI00398F6A89
MRNLLLILGYLIADSTLTDPCVNHTVLDQPWRSTDCGETDCIGNTQCDGNLVQGWYRFKSSGGWKIPETAVPEYHCSTRAPGWLNGTHPTVGQGVVTGTVCFTWFATPCYYTREITIKNCTSYSVYQLKPTHCDAVYCTDTETSPTQGPEEQSTRESTERPATIPAGSEDSDTETSPTQGPEEQSTRESTERPSTIPAVSEDSDPKERCIHVQLTSSTKLDGETKKKIVADQMNKMLNEQCPNEKFNFKAEDVESSDEN